jgi:hypothetical protein
VLLTSMYLRLGAGALLRLPWLLRHRARQRRALSRGSSRTA